MSHPIATTTLFFGVTFGVYAFADSVLNTEQRTVTATAYTSHAEQTDSTPFEPACGGDIRDHSRAIAVSVDLFKSGLRCGTQVTINGETWVVRDKMNKRFKNRIDIYAGMDKSAARKFGKRSITISWSK